MTDRREGGGWDVFGGDDDSPPLSEEGDPGPWGGDDDVPPLPEKEDGPKPSSGKLEEVERVDVDYKSSAPGTCYQDTLKELGGMGLYQRASQLVDVLPKSTGRLAPVAISEAGLTCRISDHVRYVRRKLDSKGEWKEEAVAPPKTVMSAIHRAEHWATVPYLKSITCHPVVRPDGTVQSKPGYDPRTRVLSTHKDDLKIEQLSQNSAKHAREMLIELVDEFPFVGIGADVWLAAVLTPLVRPWCGPSPMFIITSSTPSSGKGRLADLATTISCGGEGLEGGAMPPTDEEWMKTLIAWGLGAPEVIYFDNVKSGMRIGSPVLDMALTRDRFSGRILKISKIVEVELPATWIAAGNNLGTYGDTARRCLICRIEPMVERPECREFKIPDIVGYARKNRTELISCALGILSGWLTAKGPAPKPSLGSFETWSHVVRGAILWAGGADVVDALASQVEGADDGAQLHRALLESWKDTLSLPHSAAKLLERCRDKEDLASSELSAILAELCPGKGNAIHGTAQTLSTRFRAMEERVREVNGVQMTLARFECKGPIQWEVKKVQQ